MHQIKNAQKKQRSGGQCWDELRPSHQIANGDRPRSEEKGRRQPSVASTYDSTSASIVTNKPRISLIYRI